MGIFGALASAFKGEVAKLSTNYSGNDDFLKAVCASAALTANADGDIADTERKKSIDLLTAHPALSSNFPRNTIEQKLQDAFGHSKDASGRMMLARDLESVKGKANGIQMAEDVYLVAVDIAMADGSISEEEKTMMGKIAGRLGVDASKFDMI